MDTPNYQQDLASIRNIMERSVKFISLSGLSGALAGIYAVAGAAYAYTIIYTENELRPATYFLENPEKATHLLLMAALVLAASLFTGWYLSYRKAKKANTPVWSETSKRLVINLAIPLLTGGFFILILFSGGYFELLVPCSLVFYGLALIQASNHLYNEARNLGYLEIALGLAAAGLPSLGLYFWVAGFGILHIIYGFIMYRRYDRA